jgi:hypothetical protein
VELLGVLHIFTRRSVRSALRSLSDASLRGLGAFEISAQQNMGASM